MTSFSSFFISTPLKGHRIGYFNSICRKLTTLSSKFSVGIYITYITFLIKTYFVTARIINTQNRSISRYIMETIQLEPRKEYLRLPIVYEEVGGTGNKCLAQGLAIAVSRFSGHCFSYTGPLFLVLYGRKTIILSGLHTRSFTVFFKQNENQ